MLHKIIISIYFAFFIGDLSSQTRKIGDASFYADKFDGRTTASGVVFRQNKLTAAHRTLPFGTIVRVTNLENKKTIKVVINDRGPFVYSRIIDLSKSAAQKLDFIKKGVTKVKIEILDNIKKDETKVSKPTNEQVIRNIDKQNKNVIEKSVTNNSSTYYYEVATKKVSPSGFGIQVASYKESTNLIRLCNSIKDKTNKKVLIQIAEIKGQKVYRVIIGYFSTREEANNFNKNITNNFKDNFVVTF